ncbi:MAG TPA: acyl-CoA thioester hydrolase/BAAT C-terminal domain-containing protein [Bacteriovoracaceae bacterium]|nr:acyl-CoA thioester hydrolase/BAAT C-terminal domain-containing protein [Bacteriovoracaceae bacterium]
MAFSADCFRTKRDIRSSDFVAQVQSYIPQTHRGHVIIVPPTGGTNVLDRSYARSLCAAGLSAHILSNWSGDDEFNLELEIHTRFYARANRAIRVVVNSFPPGDFIGILGTSVGGIHAAIAASQLPRISTAFIITGGAHVPGIIAYSTQQAMRNAWEHRQKKYGFKNKQEYVTALEKVIELEPGDLSNSGKKLGLVIGEQDHVVPTANQERLRSLWKPQKLIVYNFDHLPTIVLTWLFNSREVVSFFAQAVPVE